MLNRLDPARYDVVLLQEPHIDHLGNTRANQSWRVVYPTGHLDAPGRTRAVTLVSTRINTSSWTMERVESRDVVLIKVVASGRTIHIYNIYNDCKNDDSMAAVMGSMRAGDMWRREEGMEIVWAGDFNRHHPTWDDDGNGHLFTRYNLRAAQRLINKVIAYDLRMVLPGGIPTLEALATKNRTRVDNVFVTDGLEERLVKCRTREGERLPKTDHFPIEVVFDLSPRLTKPERRRNFRATDWERFREVLEEKLGGLPKPREFEAGELADFLDALESLERVLEETMKEVVPEGEDVPWKKRWWSKKLERMSRELKRLGRRLERARKKRKRVDLLQEAFRKARNGFNQEVRDQKRFHWEEWLEELSEKSAWIAGKMIGSGGSDGGRTRVPNLGHEDEGGVWREAVSNNDKSRLFFEVFFPVRRAPAVPMEDRSYPARPKWRFKSISDEDVHEVIRRLKPYKKSRSDSAPNSVFVQARELLVPHLGPIYRATDTLEYYPADWKLTETPVLRKPGRTDYSVPGAYRPIVLSSGIARILNMCKTRNLTENLERHNLLPATHFGGRAGRTTTDSIQMLMKVVFDAWRRRDVAAALFLDVKGAFPSVAMDVMLHELRRKGVPEEHVGWVRRRNEGRRTRLLFDDYKSDVFDVVDGLDQGDAQSLILYLVYNSDLPAMTDKKKKITSLAFVDDVGMVATGKTFVEAHRALKDVMERRRGVMDWAEGHNCTFGLEKFQLVDFSRKKVEGTDGVKRDLPRPTLHLRGIAVKPAPHAKFLGITLDQELRWKRQSSLILAKANHWVSQLQRIARNKGGAGYRNVRQLFVGVALPRILYGIEIFDPPRRGRAHGFRSALEKKLDSLQGRVAVMIVGGLRSSPRDAAMVHARLDPIKVVIEREHAKSALRLATLPSSHPLRSHIDQAARCYVKRFPSPLHHLVNAFDVSVKTMERVVPYVELKWDKSRVRNVLSGEREVVIEGELARRPERVDVYTDGSKMKEGVAAGMVLYQRGVEKLVSGYRLGDEEEHTVYEAELVGLILAMEAVGDSGVVGEVHVGLDNQAVLTTVASGRPRFAQWLWDRFAKLVRSFLKRDRRNMLEFRWVPGHEGIEGNERADEVAKGYTAIEGANDGGEGAWVGVDIPTSRAATQQRLLTRIKAKGISLWKGSVRYQKVQRFDDSMPSKVYHKLVQGLRRKQASIIFQLRTGHVQLSKHLFTMGKADSPMCPKCGRWVETVYHYMMECVGYEVERRRYFAFLGRNDGTLVKLLSDRRHFHRLFGYLDDTGRWADVFGRFDYRPGDDGAG